MERTLLLAIVLLRASAAADDGIRVEKGRSVAIQALPTEFRANPKLAKKWDLETDVVCGLVLRNGKKTGSILSEPLDVTGFDRLGVSWDSDVPNTNVAIKVRTAKEKSKWSEWRTVNEDPQKAEVGFLAKNLIEIPQEKLVQYSIEINATPAPYSGCIRNIVFIGIKSTLTNTSQNK